MVPKSIIIFLLFVVFYGRTSTKSEESYNVKSVFVFIRHGARTPIYYDFNKSGWEKGLKKGDITLQGLYQLRSLGSSVKNSYYEYFKDITIQNDIQSVFSPMNRTIFSGLAFLDGLIQSQATQYSSSIDYTEHLLNAGYVGQQEFSHALTDRKLKIFRMSYQCKILDRIKASFYQKNPFSAILEKYIGKHSNDIIPALNQIHSNLGRQPVQNPQNIKLKTVDQAFDFFQSHRFHGQNTPEFTTNEQLVMTKLHVLRRYFNQFQNKSYFKLVSSGLFEEILNFLDKCEDSCQKLYLFSGHDTNIQVFLANIYGSKYDEYIGKDFLIPFASNIIIEVIEQNKNTIGYRLKFNGRYVKIPQCNETICTVGEFRSMVKTRIFKNVLKNCY